MREPGPSAGAAVDPSLDARVLREHVASIYYIYNATLVARVVFGLVLGAFLYSQLQTMAVVVLIGGYMLLYLCLALFSRRWSPSVPDADSARWARRITGTVVVLGIADALAPWFFVTTDNLPVTAVLVVVMLGNCARAVQSLRPIKAAMLGYTLPMMLGLISALVWRGGAPHLFLAGFVAIYLTMILRVGVREHQQLTDALLLRFEYEALAVQFREQVAATERASNEKTRFLATASHDLRQPVHAIALFGAALQNALRDRPEGQNAERLMRAVNVLGSSLDTMLDVSRLDAGVVTSAPEPVQLDALFLSLNHVYSAQAEEKELQLRLRASGLWVRSDRQLLSRMLSNLIDNALKYTPAGGVTVVARARGDRVWIDVRDTGMGIPAEQLGRIFDEFYQVENRGRDRTRGLGIGLSIVQRLSRLLGHPVEVRSVVGRGSLFRIVLPADRPVAGSAFGPRHQAVDVHESARIAKDALPRHVMVIDDEVDIREAMCAVLAIWSIESTVAADEATATALLAEAAARGEPVDMLICDYRLPDDVSGLAVGLRLRERFGVERPLLLITGDTAPDRLQQARLSGVPVLFKPVSARSLLRELAGLAAPITRPRRSPP
ncbi:hybrid sensor histidine kinase/response regulator [Variovorax sp. PAMC 28711]|uniref:hybrid sensor histidine kinase/response regulator n=1 Tax=Variovorax sp. PAMC 28711 TaxID=1795631 RepID=UPI00078DCA60|nr:hybrid sensor histidine kinase/response regulator [Variovorax sp. PAMC 28711]AMM25803.1 hybrid sensor histidine kinase/response regulator [Variovorax sp. PAMC 28711]